MICIHRDIQPAERVFDIKINNDTRIQNNSNIVVFDLYRYLKPIIPVSLQANRDDKSCTSFIFSNSLLLAELIPNSEFRIPHS